MRHYEIVFLVHPDQSDQIQRMLERYRKMVTETDGAVHRLEEWGRRQLAYPIQKLSKAFYVLMNIECAPETLAKLEESLHFNDAVLRWLVIRRKAAITEESPIMKIRERAKGRQQEQDEAAAADRSAAADSSAAAALVTARQRLPALPLMTVPPMTLPPMTLPLMTVPPMTVPPMTVPLMTVPLMTVPPMTVPPMTVPLMTVPPMTPTHHLKQTSPIRTESKVHEEIQHQAQKVLQVHRSRSQGD